MSRFDEEIKKGSDEDDQEDEFDKDAWMIVFSDLLSLLLTFFVLLYSMKSLSSKVTEYISGSFTGGLTNTSDNSGKLVSIDNFSMETKNFSDAKRFIEFIKKYRKDPNAKIETIDTTAFEESIKLLEGSISEGKDKFTITYLDDETFKSGEATLTDKAKIALDRIADLVKYANIYISIEGHTDDIPINTKRYRSNWELSIARAISTFDYLANEKKLDPDIFKERIGYGSTRTRISNINDKLRKLNRRVSITFSAKGDI